MIEIRFHGRGGQGGFTAARLLSLSSSLFEGKHSLAFPAFGPERRGAPVQAFSKIDDKKINDRSEIKYCDYIVILDESIFNKSMIDDLKEDGIVLVNSRHPENYKEWGEKVLTIDATSLALDILKRPVTNTAMIGALVGVSGIISIDSVIKGIHKELNHSIVEKNVEVLKRAYREVKGDK